MASPLGADTSKITYYKLNPDDANNIKIIATVDGARMYYSVSRNDIMLIPTKHGTMQVLDLSSPKPALVNIFTMPQLTLASDSDISPDGSSAVVAVAKYDDERKPIFGGIALINVANSAAEIILGAEGNQWDHTHFSQFDPNVICFCNNKPHNSERIWILNRDNSSRPIHLFNQVTPGGDYVVTHERAMFSKAGLVALVTAYRGPKNNVPGLYEVDFDGKVRQISASNNDNHCNISHDGRWAVVSLRGAYDPLNGPYNPHWAESSDTAYVLSDVVVVCMRTGKRAFLWRAFQAISGQPYEVQPAISPDGRWVVLKDGRDQRVLIIGIDQRALSDFLR